MYFFMHKQIINGVLTGMHAGTAVVLSRCKHCNVQNCTRNVQNCSFTNVTLLLMFVIFLMIYSEGSRMSHIVLY